MKTKLTVLLLCAALLIAMLAGCGAPDTSASAASGPEPEVSEASSAPEEAAPVSEDPAELPEAEPSETEPSETEPEEAPAVSYPLVDEPVTFTMYATATPQVITEIGELNNHQGYAMAEEITGVHMDINTVSTDQSSEQLPLIVASGDYPDLFRGVSFSNGDLDAYETEVIIDLTDYLAEYAPNYSALIDANDTIRQNVCTDEGYHLAFYRIYQENGGYDACSVTQGMLIRQDLLDRLNMEIPTNMDELTEVLTAFQRDCGLSDAMLLQASITNMGDTLVSAFGIGSAFYTKDGEALYGPRQEAFKDYLTLLNSWYQAGILNSDFISYSTNPNDETVISKITTTGGVGAFFDSAGNMNARNQQAEEGMVYTGMAALQGPDGQNHFGLDAQTVKFPSYYISTQCEDVELAVRWNDFWYSDQGILITNYGKEDQSFVYDSNGEPQWTEFVTNNPDGLTQGVVRQAYLMYTVHGICVNDNEINMLTDDAKAAVELWTTSSDRACLMPTVSYTAEESTERARLLSDINTYNDEVQLKMVIGDLDIEEYWDTYQETLTSLGIDQVLSITQDALDRFNAR